jgi:uncharacterized Zn finger protein
MGERLRVNPSRLVSSRLVLACPVKAHECGVSVRESASLKARRYVTEGRLRIRELDERGGTVKADVRGDGAIYSVGRDERGRWFCSCPACGRCAHQFAVGLVVAIGPR